MGGSRPCIFIEGSYSSGRAFCLAGIFRDSSFAGQKRQKREKSTNKEWTSYE